MKIAFLYSSMKNGGAERVIALLANSFVNSGNRVSIIVLDDQEAGYHIDEKVVYKKLGVSRNNKNFPQRMTNLYRQMKAIKSATVNTEIVVAFTAQLAVMTKIVCGKNLIVVGSERGNPFVRRPIIRNKIIGVFTFLLDGFIFQTEGAAGYYPETIKKRGIIIPNAFSLNPPEILLDFCEREKKICTTGRLTKGKRYDLIIEAFTNIYNQIPDYSLHIYGNGDLYRELKDQVQKNNMNAKIIFEGRKQDMEKILPQYRIFLLTSDYEGMPNGLIEAMGCGCACISTDCNFGPKELICDKENGLLIPLNSSDALGKAILSLTDNEKFANYIAKQAQNTQKELSREKIVEQYRQYFISLVRRKNK